MTSRRRIINNTRFNIGNDSPLGNDRCSFCARERRITRTSMQRVGVDLCKCHALFHKAQIGLVIHPTLCLFVPRCTHS